jgi:Iron-containing redox enzyme
LNPGIWEVRRAMILPPARGPLSAWLAATLRRPAGPHAAVPAPPPLPGQALPGPAVPAWDDDDLQVALWCCYELHYRGFEDVDEDWEWHPAVTAFRAALERRWAAALRDLAGRPDTVLAGELPGALRDLTRPGDGPDLAGYLARQASRDQFAEFAMHRSVYQLKEADPHSFGIPRLDGAVKAALVEIQADEYGGGRAERMHAELFRATMRWLDLDDGYGYYVPAVPAVTLAVSNLMSLFALHRRWTGALLGHLAALEMTSTGPNRLYSAGARRLGAGRTARRYFDEHVEADAVHEQVAVHDLCGGYAAARPGAAAGILFGAACCLAVDDMLARHLLSCWQTGRSSLLPVAESLTASLRHDIRPSLLRPAGALAGG